MFVDSLASSSTLVADDSIFFQKTQGGWKEVLGRFPRGGGTLYDLEFLADEKGRRWVTPACSQTMSSDETNTLCLLRVAAFGFHAGYAGAALALLDWAWQLENKEPLPSKSHYQHKSDLDSEVKEQVSKGVQKNRGKPPRVQIIGALGRCGRGVSRPHVLDELTHFKNT